MTALWLVACLGGDTSTQDSVTTLDTGCWTGVKGVLYGGEPSVPLPLEGGRIVARNADDESIETLSGVDGAFRLPVWEGTWTLSAEDTVTQCFTEEDTVVDVVQCDGTTADLYLWLCFG